MYMLVSGVPVKINEHAQEMGLMALSMLEKIQTFVNPFTNKPLEIQIGNALTHVFIRLNFSFF